MYHPKRRHPLELEPMEKNVEALIEKAAKATSAAEAMQFAQAACNAANAMCALASEKKIGK
jgi:hypothetical protein